MATTQPSGKTPATPNEFDVIITMVLAEPCDRETLENLSISVLEAVEQHASDTALGPVISAKFEPPTIELDFDVLAHTVSEVHQKMAVISQVVAQHTSLSILIVTSETWPSDHDAPVRAKRELAVA
jgi:hypothetical protein